jgi:crossover junction endodeoxyribonuclease RusA
MMFLELTIYGDPVSKARPRVGPNGHAYTPERTRAAERAVSALAAAKMAERAPADTPVGLAVEFFCATKRRSDGDNMLKLVTDAMNEIVFVDDYLIEEWYVRLVRGVGKKDARTEVTVYLLDDHALEDRAAPPATEGPGAPVGSDTHGGVVLIRSQDGKS